MPSMSLVFSSEDCFFCMNRLARMVKARRTPRQAHRNKRQDKQEKTRKADRLGSCSLPAKTGECAPPTSNWRADALAKRMHAGLVIERQGFGVSRQRIQQNGNGSTTKGERGAAPGAPLRLGRQQSAT
jgi:hypothetical protein